MFRNKKFKKKTQIQRRSLKFSGCWVAFCWKALVIFTLATKKVVAEDVYLYICYLIDTPVYIYIISIYV